MIICGGGGRDEAVLCGIVIFGEQFFGFDHFRGIS